MNMGILVNKALCTLVTVRRDEFALQLLSSLIPSSSSICSLSSEIIIVATFIFGALDLNSTLLNDIGTSCLNRIVIELKGPKVQFDDCTIHLVELIAVLINKVKIIIWSNIDPNVFYCSFPTLLLFVKTCHH